MTAERVEYIAQAVNVLTRQVNLIVADLAAFKVAYDAHVHGGITAGAANSAVTGAMTAPTAQGVTEAYRL